MTGVQTCALPILADGKSEDLLWGAAALLIGLCIAGFTVHLSAFQFRVHELGLTRRTLLGARRLATSVLEAFGVSIANAA